jgi:hypothetical protein
LDPEGSDIINGLIILCWIMILLGGGKKVGGGIFGGSKACPWGYILPWLLPIFPLLPGHHDVDCSALPCPPHHDELKLMKPQAKNKCFLP